MNGSVSSPSRGAGPRRARGHRAARRAVLFFGALLLAAAPSGSDPIPPVRACAEWEPASGTLIRWPLGIPAALVVELAEDDSLYVLVETSGQENQARNTFASYGVNLAHTRFLYANTYSHWTRDWGPLSVFDGEGRWGITDAVFNGYPWVPGCDGDGFLVRPHPGALGRGWAERREGAPPIAAGGDRVPGAGEGRSARGIRGYYDEDNLVNGVLAAEFGCPLHELPAFCTGGNIMVDGQGTAFSTRQMLAENSPQLTEAQFRALAGAFLGIGDYHFVDNPEIQGIQHIDCYAKLLDEETILVKQVAMGHPEYGCIEHLVDELAALTSCYGRPYRLLRVFCGAYSGTSTAAYTNSLILNRKVLVPLFNISSDAAALAAYADAMPGYEVIGFPWSAWYYYDALHCRTMGIFDRGMLRLAHRPLDDEVPWTPDREIVALIDDRSGAGLVADSLLVRWRVAGEGIWQAAPLEALAAPDSFRAVLPGQPPGTEVEYFLAAADHSGRRETLPRGAPAGRFRFTIVGDPSAVGLPGRGPTAFQGGLGVELGPTPSAGAFRIGVTAPEGSRVAVEVLDPTGRVIRRLAEATSPPGGLRLLWDGSDARGAPSPQGVYWVRARCGGVAATRPCVLLR
ncbi:MAG: agmatine deiminase family protein [Candidatus Eisenbacteria bacterium]|uniref:Agmatine deiminase family protein n=1 Tax=Eiseniibacteriota bacterium TaxID=2212470 RepID=A0A937XAH9_UNCEI|nr:agmatine deiminase family protein [Candidatus Eisenbacteria bacterium]